MSVPPRVLVVDDEPAIRALLAKIVERAGLGVDTAVDGAEAIEKMTQQAYAVVVLDLMMPRVDGFGVVAHVKDNMKIKPALIVATAGDLSAVRQLDGAIVHSVVRKPFEIDVLGELIVAAAKLISSERMQNGSSDTVVPFRRHGV